MDPNSLKEKTKKDIKSVKTLEDLKRVSQKYLGKKGEITQILHSLKTLPEKKRKERGKQANEIKNWFLNEIEKREKEIKEEKFKKLAQEEWLDITLPGEKIAFGHLHPITQVKVQTEEIFEKLGFSIVDGPEIEEEWYNFDALNIPKDHPARDMWDTLWLKLTNNEQQTTNNKNRKLSVDSCKLLLRTHTSPVQIRFMEKNSPPLRIIVPGRVFRHEATDASHEINFYQLEGLMVGKDISVANFKAVIEEFLERFFKKEIKIRLRPSYFPFTEPSFEVDLLCLNCSGNGCSICQRTGWIEIMGAGMVHPNVLKNSHLNPREWQGFAFGVGLDRLAMMKYKINDIRLFYSGDLRFLKQF